MRSAGRGVTGVQQASRRCQVASRSRSLYSSQVRQRRQQWRAGTGRRSRLVCTPVIWQVEGRLAVQCNAVPREGMQKSKLRMRMRSNEVCRYGGVSRLMGTVHAETSTLTSRRWGRSDLMRPANGRGNTRKKQERERLKCPVGPPGVMLHCKRRTVRAEASASFLPLSTTHSLVSVDPSHLFRARCTRHHSLNHAVASQG